MATASDPVKKTPLIHLLLVVGFGVAFAGEKPAVSNSNRSSESALIGTFYDFKQDQKRGPLPMDRHVFEEAVAKFIDTDWDEGMFSKYYRVPRPLYTTELFIDTINSETGPKAFGVEKTVQQYTWLVYYKGQVMAPEDGLYRFLGDADDFVAVAVNGKTVLVADIPGTRLRVKWFAKEAADVHGKWGGDYTAGDWFEAKAGRPIDVDIITGDSPGGQFRCKLCIQKKGFAYKNNEVPPFQLAPTKDTPPGVPTWKGVQ